MNTASDNAAASLAPKPCDTPRPPFASHAPVERVVHGGCRMGHNAGLRGEDMSYCPYNRLEREAYLGVLVNTSLYQSQLRYRRTTLGTLKNGPHALPLRAQDMRSSDARTGTEN